MSFDITYYGTLNEANAYFAARLHATAWDDAVAADKPKALWAATKIIDALNFKGSKSTVYALADGATLAEVQVAEAAQALEFPRDADTEVPEAVRIACYELGYSLLDGRDPELELEAVGIASHTYGAVKTIYSRDQVPITHLINGVPSAQAWRLLQPFLRQADGVTLSRVN